VRVIQLRWNDDDQCLRWWRRERPMVWDVEGEERELVEESECRLTDCDFDYMSELV